MNPVSLPTRLVSITLAVIMCFAMIQGIDHLAAPAQSDALLACLNTIRTL